ncbi:MAG: hypothetical protein H0U00_11950 [Actinobacteria bacterium]|nr:hypothetical protein [Actinomycetota bacterium]
MTYLDAYCLVALVANEAAAQEVDELLRGGGCRVVAVNLAEAIDVAVRTHPYPFAEVRKALEPLVLGGHLTVAVSGEAEAWLAAEVRVSEPPLEAASVHGRLHVAGSRTLDGRRGRNLGRARRGRRTFAGSDGGRTT